MNQLWVAGSHSPPCRLLALTVPRPLVYRAIWFAWANTAPNPQSGEVRGVLRGQVMWAWPFSTEVPLGPGLTWQVASASAAPFMGSWQAYDYSGAAYRNVPPALAVADIDTVEVFVTGPSSQDLRFHLAVASSTHAIY